MRSVLLCLFILVMKSTHQRQHRGAESGRIYCIIHCMGVGCLKLNAISGPRLFHSFPWLRQKQRVNPSLLLTGSLPVREAECQGEKEMRGRGWERMRSKGTQYILENTVMKSDVQALAKEFFYFLLGFQPYHYFFFSQMWSSVPARCNDSVRQQIQWKDPANPCSWILDFQDIHTHVYIYIYIWIYVFCIVHGNQFDLDFSL